MRSCTTIACPRVRLVFGQMRRAGTICFGSKLASSPIASLKRPFFHLGIYKSMFFKARD